LVICDIATVGATVHYTHLALHLGLAAIVSLGGGVFLGLGIVASLRARRERRALPAEAGEQPGGEGPLGA
jgi:hypothetical protein